MFCLIFALSTVTVSAYHDERVFVSEYVVIFSKLPNNYENIIERSGGRVMDVLEVLGAVRVSAKNESFLREIRKNPDVKSAGIPHPIYLDSLTSFPASDLFSYQWDIAQVTNNGESWAYPGGTGKSVDGNNIVVAVIDSGIDYTHPDLQENYLYGKSFVNGDDSPEDVVGHGTAVAGMIAANGRILGVGPNLKLASYRVIGADNKTDSYILAQAIIEAADDDVDVINLSTGGYIWLQNPRQDIIVNITELNMLADAIEYAINKGVTVVNSAGNDGLDTSNPNQLTRKLHKAEGITFRNPFHSGMITVSGGTVDRQRARHSNFGRGVIDVMAPSGEDGIPCLTTMIGGNYAFVTGTSVATPKVSALAAVIIAKHGKNKLRPQQVEHIIKKSAVDVMQPGVDAESGYGLINAVNALKGGGR